MKKIIHITIVTTILIIPLVSINAQNVGVDVGANVEARPMPQRPFREIRDDAREDMREIREEARGERKGLFEEGRKEIRNASGTPARKEVRAGVKADLKANMEKRKAAVEARRVELKAQVEAKKAENKQAKAAKLDEKKRGKVETTLASIYKRLNERLNVLTRVDAEFTTRLNRLSVAGVDVTATRALQVTAQTALAKAKVDVDATQALAAAEAMSTTTKETLRGLVQTAETSLKAAAESYRKLADAVKALPKPVVKAEVKAEAKVQ